MSALKGLLPDPRAVAANLQDAAPRKVSLDIINVKEGFNERGFVTGEAAFQGESFDRLVSSIRRYGDVLQPLLLRPDPVREGEYLLVAGERRLMAALKAGLRHLTCVVRSMTDEEAERLSREENMLREQVEKIDHILSMLHVLARRIGVAPASLRTLFVRIRNAQRQGQEFEPDSQEARLLALTEEFGLPSVSTLVRAWTRYLDLRDLELTAIREGLSEGAALALLDLGDRPERDTLLGRAVDEGLNAEQVAAEVRRILGHGEVNGGLQAQVKRLSPLLSAAGLRKLPAERQEALRLRLQELEAEFLEPREKPRRGKA